MPSERGIYASAYALVHATVTTHAERARHASFLAHMLLLAFAALAVAPPFLAFHGAPTPAESLLFALSFAPAGAAMAVARSGRLALGHLIAAAGLAAGAVVLLLVVRAGTGAAIAWLVAAYVEAAASPDRRAARLAGIVAGALLVVIVAASFDPRLAPTVSPIGATLLASLAILAAAPAAGRTMTTTVTIDDAGAGLVASGAVDAMLEAAIVGLDASGYVVCSTRPGSGFLAVAEDAILGRGLLERVLVADRPAFLKLIDDAAHGGQSVRGTFRMRAMEPEGRSAEGPRYANVEMRARPAPEGGPCEIVAVLRDLTERDRRELEVAQARHVVEETLRTKDQFLTTMSHELRTPLNSIIGFSEILASRTTRPDDTARQCELARVINQSGQHLLTIVNTVLDLSRVQSGSLTIQPEPFDAVAMLERSIEAVAAEARDASLRLVRDWPATLEEMVGDGRVLKRALVALLSNAVKFTPAGGEVTLKARPEGNALVVTVSDTGIGISAENLARIGDPFFQAHGSLDRSFDGPGLGLALTRGLVGLHGGALTIESAVGLGTLATIKLPLDCRAVAADPAAAIATSILPRKRPRPSMPIKDAA